MAVVRKKLDVMFSRLVRGLCDWTCQRCGKKYPQKHQGLHNSHYYGRSRANTRYSLRNCTALCYGCHRYLDSNPTEHHAFKVEQLGDDGFAELMGEWQQDVKVNKAWQDEKERWIKDQLQEIE